MTLPAERPLTRKEQTFNRIQEVAMRLFLEKGYDATTVEEIAAAAGVSHMTVFRHFPTKEALIFTDRFDPLMAEAIRRRPATEPPLDSIVSAVIDLVHDLSPEEIELHRRRSQIARSVPALRERVAANTMLSTDAIAQALRDRGGFPPDSPLPMMAARLALAMLMEIKTTRAETPTHRSLANEIREAYAMARAAFGIERPG
jgi:AcrR family transcriptional regulator